MVISILKDDWSVQEPKQIIQEAKKSVQGVAQNGFHDGGLPFSSVVKI